MDLRQFYIVAYFSIGSSLLPIGVGLIRSSRLDSKAKAIVMLSIFAFVMDFVPIWIKSLSNALGNTYRLLEFIILLIIYYLALGRKSRNTFVAIGVAYILFFFSDLLFFQAGQLNSFSVTLTAAVFIVFSVLHFFKLMRELPSTHIHQLPMFWIDTAVLVYFAGAFFIFLLRSYLVEVMKDNQIVYWSLHNILNIIKNILFAIGLWQATKNPILNSETK
jgi:hypothetical protein